MKKEDDSLKLSFELVPRTAWFSNLRSMVSKEDWDVLRKECYKQAGGICEVCGGKGTNHPVEAHEVWSYDDRNKIQKLVRLIALCPSCHDVKHIGNAFIRGKHIEAMQHFVLVNNLTEKEAHNLLEKAMKLWEKRSAFEWNCDVTWLNTKGITYNPERQIQGDAV